VILPHIRCIAGPLRVAGSGGFVRTRRGALDEAADPESNKQAGMLRALIVDTRRIDFVILLCMMPFAAAPRPKELLAAGSKPASSPFEADFRRVPHHQFAHVVATY
jgi:hypothetical protein